MATQSFDLAVSRLAQYRPFEHEGQDVRAAVRDLILGAAAEAGGGFSSLADCREAVRTLWGLEIELDELRDTVAELAEAGHCVKDGGSLQLSDEVLERLEAQAAGFKETEQKAFHEWEATVRVLEPDLTEDDFEALRQDLDIFLQKVIGRHGVEAALILYPENPRAKELHREVEEIGLDFLPTRSTTLHRVREHALQLFLRQPTDDQRVFLANLLNVSYFLTVLSLDPSASQLVQAQVRGHRIYLDTNVLYPALGLTRAREVLSVRRMLDLTKTLGYELAITPWTLTELQESLGRAERIVRQRALPPRELADLMADATSEEGFVSAYWRHYKSKGVSPKDFFQFYSALETLLDQDGIKVISEGCDRVDRNPGTIDHEVALLDRMLVKEKAEVVLIHDAKHRLLIDQQRGSGHLRFSNARYWFLTRDSALPRYAQRSVDDSEVQLPFCVSTSAWAQIMRSLTPRTQDLDQALVDLLASPYIRYRGGINPQVVQQVVGRIDQYKGMSPKLASEVLLNGALVRDVARTDDPQLRTKKIDDAIVSGAERLHVRLDTLTAKEAEQREALRWTEAEKNAGVGQLTAAHRRIAELEQAVADKQEAETRLGVRFGQSEQEHKNEQDKALRQVKEERGEREKLAERLGEQETALQRQSEALQFQARIFRYLAACIPSLLGIGGVLLVVARVVEHAWPVTGVVVGVIGCLVLTLSILLGRKRGWWALGAIAIVVGLVAAVEQIVDQVSK